VQPARGNFSQKFQKIFWGGGTAPSPDPTPDGEGDTPSPYVTPLVAFGHSPLVACGHSLGDSNLAPAVILKSSAPMIVIIIIILNSKENPRETVERNIKNPRTRTHTPSKST